VRNMWELCVEIQTDSVASSTDITVSSRQSGLRELHPNLISYVGTSSGERVVWMCG